MRHRQVKPGTTVWADRLGVYPRYINLPRTGVVCVYGPPGQLAQACEYRRKPYSKERPYRGLVALEHLRPLRGKASKTAQAGREAPFPSSVHPPSARLRIVRGTCHRWHNGRPARDPTHPDLCAECGRRLQAEEAVR
jgi:hypothetical protein